MVGRVVPSQVVTLIQDIFPWTATQQDSPASRIVLGIQQATTVAAIVETVDRIPEELIILGGTDYIRYIASLTALRNSVEEWRLHGRSHSIYEIEGMGHLNPLTILRRVLERCPDAAPAPGTTELAFIPDADLREALRTDISEATRALASGGWKAATVVAGSVVEALLLWALDQQPPAARTNAIASLMTSRILTKSPSSHLDEWGLHEYIEVAEHLKVIKSDTADQARIAKNFRNLIHPGRAARLGQACDRGTALSALAAVEHVVRDITP